MKKLVAIFVLCFLTGIATVHAAYQRHQKQPNFFMPANAVQNTIDKPNFKPVYRQQTPQNNLGSASSSRPTKPAATPKQNANSNISTKNDKQKTAVLTETNQTKKTPTPTPNNILSPKNLPIVEKKTVEAVKPALPESAVAQIKKEAVKLKKNKQISQTKQAEKARLSTAERLANSADTPFNNIDELYVQSFREYAQDLSKIAKGEKVQNDRLFKNLSEFQNIEHTVVVQ